MGLTFYNAKPDKSGCGCGFSFNSKDGAIYSSFVKQSDWNATKKTGVFNGDRLNLKFSTGEAGGIISAIERMESFTAYHDTGKGDYGVKYTTQITFMPFGEAGKERFGFSVKKKEDGIETKFSVAFSKGDAVTIREYLKFALNHVYTADYSEEVKRRKEAAKQPNRVDDPAAGKTTVSDDDDPF